MKIIFSPSKEMREENIFENKKIEFTESKFKDKTNILIKILEKSMTAKDSEILKKLKSGYDLSSEEKKELEKEKKILQ